jgi:hypothetical protein
MSGARIFATRSFLAELVNYDAGSVESEAGVPGSSRHAAAARRPRHRRHAARELRSVATNIVSTYSPLVDSPRDAIHLAEIGGTGKLGVCLDERRSSIGAMTDWFARPVLHVSNVEASLRFYVDRLGFTVAWRYLEDRSAARRSSRSWKLRRHILRPVAGEGRQRSDVGLADNGSHLMLVIGATPSVGHEQHGQIAHRRIVPRSRDGQESSRTWNSPCTGSPTTATTSGLSGSLATSTAQATVTLPPGAGIVTATATFNVGSSQGAALSPATSPLIDGERPQQVEVVAMADGTSRTYLLSRSGARFELGRTAR